MNVLVDGEVLTLDGVATVGDALAAAADRSERSGRLIVEVTVDGEVWNERRIDEALTGACPAGTVCLTTCSAGDVVADAFRDAAAALAEADHLQRDAADHLQAGRQSEAMTRLDDAIRIWRDVRQALEMGLHVGAGLLGSMPDLESRLDAAVSGLNGRLTAIRDALQCDDPVVVSDTLLYDLPDIVLQWRGLLHDLQANLTR